MPLKFGLPATVAGRVIGAWPDVRVMDAEMTAPAAAAVIATVSIESAKRSRMRASLCCWHHCSGVLLLLRSLLLERIVFNAHEIRRVVLGCRVRAAPFRISEFL